ncbi:MAG: hypothetical protein II602_00815 [Erysipelotrichales bacterium]|nr:hypothetical protein [Erysipelotrichales bacterium]
MKKTICLLMAVLMFCAAFSGCAKEKPVTPENPGTDPGVNPVGEVTKPKDAIGFGMNSNDAKLLDILSAGKEDNLFVSAMSLDIALGMLMSGANGSSYDALCAYLGLTKEEAANIVKDLMEEARLTQTEEDNPDRSHPVVSIANSFWFELGQDVSADYMAYLQKYYDAECAEVDFKKDAAERINAWCTEKTRDLIKEVVSKKMLEKASDVLVNAIYFKAHWAKEFAPAEKEDFTLFGGKTVSVDMMHGKGDEYMENDQAIAFSKRYSGGYRFVGILPKNTGDFTFESLKLKSLFDSVSWDYDVYVNMPKLDIQYSVSLVEPLKQLGLEVLFTEQADFSGIANSLKVSDIIQKSVLKLDEKGTEAAAVTVISMETTAMPVQRQEKSVSLDRPFAFMIMDANDNVLFAGKVLNPNK